MYKIAIIVPVFNVGNLLYDAFESIKNQTIGFENLEIYLLMIVQPIITRK